MTYLQNYELAEPGFLSMINLKNQHMIMRLNSPRNISKNKFKAGDNVAYTPPLGAPEIPLTKGKVYTIKRWITCWRDPFG